jgi:ribonucleoside-diphosphate reductase alpha chain
MNYVLEAASRRQKWIDQAQSLNVYIAKPSGKKLDQVYRQAWKIGLKTTYYLRSLAATSTEKSTVSKTDLNAVSSGPSAANAPKVCSILDPDCDACQ